MKKILCLLLSALFCIAVFAGCGKKDTGYFGEFDAFQSSYTAALANYGGLETLTFKEEDPVTETDIGKITVHTARIPSTGTASSSVLGSGNVTLYCDKKTDRINSLIILVYDPDVLEPYAKCAIETLTPDANSTKIISELGLVDPAKDGDKSFAGEDGVDYSFHGSKAAFTFLITRFSK